MKKDKFSILLFVAAFFAAYLIICFKIPGMRIKLAAEPKEFFIESIKHQAFFKSVISFAAALIVDMLQRLLRRKNHKFQD